MTHYLEQYDATPEADKFPLVRKWLDTEPLAFFKELREKRPVLVTPACTLLARFDHVTDVLLQPKIFTTALYLPKMGNGVYLMCHDDDALHTREKSIMQSLLNRDDLPRVRAMVAKIASGLLDAATDKRIEAIDGYTRLVPAMLVQQYFGLTGRAPAELMEWSFWNQIDTFHNQPFDLLSDARRAEITKKHDETGKQLEIYIGELIAARLIEVKLEQATAPIWVLRRGLRALWRMLTGAPTPSATDNIVTRMLRSGYPDQVDFDLKRVAVNAGGLLIGAIETTSPAAAQVMQFLLQRPELLSRAQAAARLPDTTEFDGIVWEALRYVPISPYLFRECAQSAVVARGTPFETTLPPGTLVLALVQSAMFDPAAFDQPDEFNSQRNWYHYFHFGFGSHECLGRYVGMVMIPEMVRQMMLRPGLHASQPIDYQGGPFPRQWTLSWTGAPVS